MTSSLRSTDLKAMMAAHIAAFDALTPEDLARTARERLRQALPTYLESWPPELAALSVPQACLDLSEIEVAALLAALGEDEGPDDPSWDPALIIRNRAALAALEARIAAAAFSEGFFIRLSSRSPKDSWDGLKHGFCCRTGRRALDLLLGSSERIWEDLTLQQRAGHPSKLYLRAWRDIPPWAEFRCLVRGRRVVGISQYAYREGAVFPEITTQAAALEKALRDYLVDKAIPACPLDDVVIDLALEGGRLDRPFLVEINPFGADTDPCLFRQANPMSMPDNPGDLGEEPEVTDMAPGPLLRHLGDGCVYPFVRQPVAETVDDEVMEVASVAPSSP